MRKSRATRPNLGRLPPSGLCEAAARRFEVGGAWGPSAVHAFHEVLEVYAQTNMVDIEHHSVISFATHWRERVAMAITRGAAAVVARVAPLDGEAASVVGTADTSHEHNPDAR